MARFSPEDRRTIWDMREAGVPVKRIARHLGRQNSSLRRFIADAGGRVVDAARALRAAAEVGRARRDLAWFGGRVVDASDRHRPGSSALDGVPGGQGQWRPSALSGPAGRSGGRPAGAATEEHQAARCPRLRRAVEAKLEDNWSPEQISSWLADAHPHDPEMQVSHETIYQSLFVQGKGALRKELHTCLRSGRAMRRAKAYSKASHVGAGKLKNMVMISERPAEVADRAVPGLWEGDLIFGKKMTAVATLVERHSRYVMLAPQRIRGRSRADRPGQEDPHPAGESPNAP
jgi:IS30 family transposase